MQNEFAFVASLATCSNFSVAGCYQIQSLLVYLLVYWRRPMTNSIQTIHPAALPIDLRFAIYDLRFAIFLRPAVT